MASITAFASFEWLIWAWEIRMQVFSLKLAPNSADFVMAPIPGSIWNCVSPDVNRIPPEER